MVALAQKVTGSHVIGIRQRWNTTDKTTDINNKSTSLYQ